MSYVFVLFNWKWYLLFDIFMCFFCQSLSVLIFFFIWFSLCISSVLFIGFSWGHLRPLSQSESEELSILLSENADSTRGFNFVNQISQVFVSQFFGLFHWFSDFSYKSYRYFCIFEYQVLTLRIQGRSWIMTECLICFSLSI